MASSKCSGECGPGNFSKAGASECRVCGISEFSRGGAEACINCGIGETTVIKGASTCVCQIGFFAKQSKAQCTQKLPGGEIKIVRSTLYPTFGTCCTKCPAGFECDHAGVTLASANLKPGFWRSDNSSLRARPCPSIASCNGSSSLVGGCPLGHEGPFCSLCTKNFTRFSEASKCEPCPSGENEGNAVAALVGIIAGGLVVSVMYALFNHKIPKGVLKPLVNGMQCTSKEDEIERDE